MSYDLLQHEEQLCGIITRGKVDLYKLCQWSLCRQAVVWSHLWYSLKA